MEAKARGMMLMMLSSRSAENVDDDDVYYYNCQRLKLEGETENMCLWTKKRGRLNALALMATPCPKSLHGKGEKWIARNIFCRGVDDDDDVYYYDRWRQRCCLLLYALETKARRGALRREGGFY